MLKHAAYRSSKVSSKVMMAKQVFFNEAVILERFKVDYQHETPGFTIRLPGETPALLYKNAL